MKEDRAFEEFVRARMPHLLRFGRALTCDDRAAGTLVTESLGPVLARWDESSAYTAEDDVRRGMVDRYLRAKNGTTPGEQGLAERDDETWELVAQLAPKQRTALALLLHEDLTDGQAADVLRCSTGTAQALAGQALEDLDGTRVRRAFEEPVALDENQLVVDVRREAERAARRRSLLVAAGVVLVLVALTAGVVVSALRGESATEPPGLVDEAFALATTGPEDVWVVTAVDGCPDCSRLWRGDGTALGWSEVFEFDRPPLVARLVMAPNGEDGWAWFGRDWLQATHDGGRTWVIPGIDMRDFNVDVKLAGDTVWVLLHSPRSSRLYTSQVGSDEYDEVAELTDADRYSLVPFQEQMLLMTYFADGSTTLTPALSDQPAQPIPCDQTPPPPRASSGVLWLTCNEGGGLVRVLRSPDARTWEEVYASESTAPGSYPVSDDTTFVVTREGGRLIGKRSAADVPLDIELGEFVTDGGFVDEKVGYLVTGDGRVLRSADGGRTWREIG